MNSESVECVALTPEKLLFADERRAWLETAGNQDAQCADAFSGPQSLARTRKLLEGALGVAWREGAHAEAPPMTAIRWVWRLSSYYHLTHHTPGLMEEAAHRFALAGRPELEAWALCRAREESGHDRLALRDLEALGYPAQEVVETLVPANAAALVDWFRRSVYTPDPLGSVGYSFALERLAMGVGESEIRRIDALFPPGVRATRCMRVHSQVGSDADHVTDTVEVVAHIDPAARAAIVRAVYETGRLCSLPLEPYRTDEELDRLLNSIHPAVSYA